MINSSRISPTEQITSLDKFSKLNKLAKSIYEANESNPTFAFMDITSDEVKNFLRSLHTHKVKYMLVGGIATVFHGHVRTTQDLDLWVKDSPKNKVRLVEALKEVNVPGAEHYLNVPMIPGWSTLTIGNNGFVADFMSYMKAFSKDDFDLCYQHAKHGEFEDTPITVIHLNDLIKEKQTLGRPKDIDDVSNLKRIQLSKDKRKR